MKRIISIGIILLTLVGCNYFKQKNTTTLNVYELHYGDKIYRITSANLLEDDGYNIILKFCSNDNYNPQDIYFIPGNLFRITKIRSFNSKQDTTSYIRIR